MFQKYDVIVVGAGHAGCEAAMAAGLMGAKTLLITMNMQTFGQMSCNPAMGGIAKGQIVKEIDALGGQSGIVTDETMIQFRMLNKSKGPAMWSPRAQSDKLAFSIKWRALLESNPHLDLYQDMVKGLMVKDNRICGVQTSLGQTIESKTVVLTNGTFLNGIIHVGEQQMSGGRAGEKAASGITEQLISLGFESKRLKTGTPPRIDGRSLDYSAFDIQNGDEEIVPFSYLPTKTLQASEQKCCWITYTDKNVHAILEEGFDQSPMYAGRIQGSGPRYCPSIEDKIKRFAERDRHQLFIEPEGHNTIEIYLNGFSTSLPVHIQDKALRQLPGFKNYKMFRPGYAIEYDYFPPVQLKYNLETKAIHNLFFAGQINGTTGYEEAAGQGLMAGINAVQNVRQLEPFILNRNEAYIGVLIDDLITKGTEEPYRMFTSRAEFRTLLRQDNADLRLTKKGYELGLASAERHEKVLLKQEGTKKMCAYVEQLNLSPDEINPFLESKNSAVINKKYKAIQILSRPTITLKEMLVAIPHMAKEFSVYDRDVIEQVEIQIKYATYIEKEMAFAERLQEINDIKIPDNFDYAKINSLGSEAKDKLQKIKPKTLGQAANISGINPTDIQILMVLMGR